MHLLTFPPISPAWGVSGMAEATKINGHDLLLTRRRAPAGPGGDFQESSLDAAPEVNHNPVAIWLAPLGFNEKRYDLAPKLKSRQAGSLKPVHGCKTSTKPMRGAAGRAPRAGICSIPRGLLVHQIPKRGGFSAFQSSRWILTRPT